MADELFRFIGELVTYGGGIVVISFAVFKALSQKWLENKFAARLQALKAAQDEQLRYVQSYIDREIHRARKLYDREFDTLPEAWRLLCTSFRNGQATIVDSYPQLAQYSKAELMDLLSTTTMRQFEKNEMLSMDSSEWTEHFRRWNNFQKLTIYRKERKEFRDYLAANAIFFSAGFKEKFEAIDAMVGNAIQEMDDRVRGSINRPYTESLLLNKDGPALLLELESLIQIRLWSSDASKSGSVGV